MAKHLTILREERNRASLYCVDLIYVDDENECSVRGSRVCKDGAR
jgi:hypothetical protein